jgi:hypothetical protein
MKLSKLIYTVIFLVLLIQVSFGQGIKIKPGTNVTINNNTTLKVAGGDNLSILDDQSYAPSLLEKGSLAFTGGGEIEVQQYLEKNEWHIVSSPVSDENISVYMDMFLYAYDEPSDVFNNLYYPVSTPLNVGQGYHVWSVATSPNVVSFKGSTNKTDINLFLTVTNATNNSGWNLLGNPFPCTVDWNGDASWNLNNVSSTIYLYDAAAGNYKTWNFNMGGIGTNGKTNGYIAATQGFWVRTSDTIGSQPSYSLTIPASQRVASPSTEFYKEGQIIDKMLRLEVRSENFSDELIIAFNPKATDGFDNGFDAHKLFTEISSPKLFSIIGNSKYAVNFLHSIKGNEIIPVSFHAGSEENFIISANGVENFPENLPIYLEDKLNNAFINLRESPNYSFTASDLDNQNRFIIHFSGPIGIEEPGNLEMESIQIYSWNKSIFVEIPFEFTGNIEVYDILGKKAASSKALKGKNEISLSDAKGYYIVRVIGDTGLKTRKVNIR